MSRTRTSTCTRPGDESNCPTGSTQHHKSKEAALGTGKVVYRGHHFLKEDENEQWIEKRSMRKCCSLKIGSGTALEEVRDLAPRLQTFIARNAQITWHSVGWRFSPV
mmetsp:Transcript_22563/g.56013  ORF Transcript_22563/g.56013 Transcript_22563/m.56013 type:complete len:107 (-) Transcript_22563:476-796(-)